MKSRFRYRPPKTRFAHRSGRAIRPISRPAGVNTRTPSSSSPAHSPAAPQVAVLVAAKTVRNAVLALDEGALIGQCRSPGNDVKDDDGAVGYRPALDDVQSRLVRCEGEAVGGRCRPPRPQAYRWPGQAGRRFVGSSGSARWPS